MRISPTAFLTGALLALSLAAAAQQTPASTEPELTLGREYLAAKNYESAALRLEALLRRQPEHAEAHLLLGQCYAQLGRLPEARAELARAVTLHPAYEPQAAALRAQADAQANSAADAQTRGQAEAAAVRARAAAALQARAAAEAAAKAGGPRGAAPMAAAHLVYGDYLCTYNLWDAAGKRMNFIPKGAIQLNANGTYRYLDGGAPGRYTYDATTRQLTWLTGYFAERGKPKTTFSADDKAAQLGIEFSTATGTQNWSCGCNRK
ncbi:hypothetical protein GCM10027048_04270 [Hymenobacter coalescens]